MPALIERPKMTKAMYQALKKHIVKEREKKKQGINYMYFVNLKVNFTPHIKLFY